MKKLKLYFPLMILFLLIGNAVSIAEDDYEVWNLKVTDDNYKVWTVTFNQRVDTDSVTKNTVYVLNQFNRRIPVSVSLLEDGKSVTVTPIQMYLSNHTYELVIKGLQSGEGEVLSPSVKMPFEIVRENKDTQKTQGGEPPSSSTPSGSGTSSGSHSGTNNGQTPTSSSPQKEVAIKDINVDLNSLVATVIVTTSDEVAMVKLDGITMHYEGNNVYKLSKAGLNKSQSLTVEAFATHERNSLLERKTHQVR